jgi:hypothetical protein
MKRRKGNVTRRRGAKCQAKLDSSYCLFVCLFVLGVEMPWICFVYNSLLLPSPFGLGFAAVKFKFNDWWRNQDYYKVWAKKNATHL